MENIEEIRKRLLAAGVELPATREEIYRFVDRVGPKKLSALRAAGLLGAGYRHYYSDRERKIAEEQERIARYELAIQQCKAKVARLTELEW